MQPEEHGRRRWREPLTGIRSKVSAREQNKMNIASKSMNNLLKLCDFVEIKIEQVSVSFREKKTENEKVEICMNLFDLLQI